VVRHFEFVSGGSAKFWQVERDGAVVSVQYGRIGTTGQSQVKQLASETVAIAHVDKLIAEKVKKGYTEVASGTVTAPPPPASAPAPAPAKKVAEVASAPEPEAPPPGEDVFVLPESWRRSFYPRRGGSPGPLLPTGAEALTRARRIVREQQEGIEKIFDHLASNDEIADQAKVALRSVLDGDGSEGSAVGAAALVAAMCWDHVVRERTQPLADVWVAARGVVFAATVAIESVGLFVGNHQRSSSPEVGAHIRPIRDGDRGLYWMPDTLVPFAARVRAHLAVASDADYAAAGTVLLGYRGGIRRQRILATFLMPDRTRWVEEDCDEPKRQHYADQVLLCSVSTTEQFARIAGHAHASTVRGSLETLVTLADGVGPAITPLLAGWFDDQYTDAEDKRRVLTVLAALPTDEAFTTLLDRVDKKYVQPAIVEATKRFPVRALRLLAAAPTGTGAAARATADLLRGHVLSNPAVVAATLPDLPEESRQRVETVQAANVMMPEAPAELLPAVFTAPPWTVRRAAAKPVVVPGLTPQVTSAIEWLPGERAAWIDGECDYPRKWGDHLDWAVQRERYLSAQLSTYNQAGFFLRGPDAVVRPLVPDWRPKNPWWYEGWLDQFVARFELAGLPAALHVARQNTAAASSLLPYADAEVATTMADWFVRLKSVRQTAHAWLLRHPAAAASALVPDALSKPGPARRAAEQALRAIVAGGHRAAVAEAAQRYGAEAAAGIETLLATDPLDLLPARMPVIPGWVEPAMLPQVLLRDRAHALPEAAIPHLCTMLALSKPGEVYAGVAVAKETCDPRSLAEFGWTLFQRWQAAGAPPKESWVLDALSLIGDDETVRRLSPVIRAWPGEGGHSKAVAGLEVLATIGTDVALMHLHSIAEKAKFKGLKERAAQKIADVAAQLGLRPEELADRLVPDLGLDASGSLTLDYGPRRFVVGFDEQLKPYVTDEGGARRKDLPKPGARDDDALATAAYQRFAGLKKDVRTIAADQIRRLELAMIQQRRWSGAEFRALFVAHPLLWHIVRRLVWATFDDAAPSASPVTAFRVAEDRSLADVDDEVTTLDDAATVGVAHPLHLGDALPGWVTVFADYEILQPFPQLAREVYHLTDSERAATTLDRFKGHKVPTGKVLGLERRGWRRGEPQDAGIQGWVQKTLPGNRTVVIGIDPGIPIGYVDEWPEQVLEEIWVNQGAGGGWSPSGDIRLGELDAVTASEVVRDLHEVMSP
jgi:predicted DNA-binding WGR domain protein/plasmid stabilization system protein ParE